MKRLSKQLIPFQVCVLTESARSQVQKAKIHWEQGYSGILHF